MADTFVKIASVTVGSGGASSIDFTSIPSTYTDLCLKVSGRSTTSAGAVWNYFELRPNGSTSSGSFRQLYGTGSAAASGFGSINFGGYANDSSATTSTFGNSETYICNYAGSTNKSWSNDSVTENNATGALTNFSASLWSNTSAITSLTLVLGTGNWAQYSTAVLYGIKNS